MTKLTKDELRAIKALKRMAKKWPSSLWLFAGGGQLWVMRYGDDGDAAMTEFGGVDPAYCVTEIDIPCDGGGW